MKTIMEPCEKALTETLKYLKKRKHVSYNYISQKSHAGKESIKMCMTGHTIPTWKNLVGILNALDAKIVILVKTENGYEETPVLQFYNNIFERGRNE